MRVDRFSTLLVLALVVTVGVAAPAADAHAGPHGYQATRLVDGLLVTFELDGALPMTDTDLRVFVIVESADWGEDAGVESVNVAFHGPNGESFEVTPEAGNAYKEASVTFQEEGSWRANVTVQPHNASVEYPFRVYPAGPYVWESPNAASTFQVVGETSDVQFLITDWRTGERASAPRDATALLEHWSDDHETLYDTFVVDLEAVGPGLLVLRHAFEDAGMYHVLIASETLGLDYEDRPYEHVYVLSEEEAREMGWTPAGGNGIPGAGVPVILAALAGAAAVSVVHARRR
jgi:hypothetical protein